MLLSEFIETYFEVHVNVHNKPSTQVAKRQILRTSILPLLGSRELVSISKADILILKARCFQAGLANKTINNVLTTLSSILVIAEEMELIQTIPKIKRVKATAEPKRALKPLELTALIEAAPPPWSTYIKFVSLTGLRIGELRALEHRHLRFRANPPMLDVFQTTVGNWNYIGTPKGAPRSIPVNLSVQLLAHKLKSLNKYFLALPLLPEAPLSYGRCQTAIRQARLLAGINWPVSWHTLRHTFATNLADKAVSIQMIQALLGHSTISTTERYTHLNSDALLAAVQVLDKT